MGVRRCDRAGCENVMCNRLSTNLNEYICDDCFQEMKDELGEKATLAEIRKFMNTDKEKTNKVYLENEFIQ